MVEAGRDESDFSCGSQLEFLSSLTPELSLNKSNRIFSKQTLCVLKLLKDLLALIILIFFLHLDLSFFQSISISLISHPNY